MADALERQCYGANASLVSQVPPGDSTVAQVVCIRTLEYIQITKFKAFSLPLADCLC